MRFVQVKLLCCCSKTETKTLSQIYEPNMEKYTCESVWKGRVQTPGPPMDPPMIMYFVKKVHSVHVFSSAVVCSYRSLYTVRQKIALLFLQ